MECVQKTKATTGTHNCSNDKSEENDSNNAKDFDGQILGLAEEAKRNLIEQKRSKTLRFGIDFILKDNEPSDKVLPLTSTERVSEKCESDNNNCDKDLDLSDAGSDVNTDNDSEGNDVISSTSSLNVFGYPQLSVLIRSNNTATLGPEFRVFPPSVQIGAVGLQLSSFNDVRKDRFGCE